MSRNSIDTDILRIRNVTAINSSNSDYIQPSHVPSIGLQGQLEWFSTLVFLSTIMIPSPSCTALDILTTIQGGISTMAYILENKPGNAINLNSTIDGLGSSAYISSAYIQFLLNEVSGEYGYISSTTLYDVINNLNNLPWITQNAGPMKNIGSNLVGAYIKTTPDLVSAVQGILIQTAAINFNTVSTIFISTPVTKANVITSISSFTSNVSTHSMSTLSLYTNIIFTNTATVYSLTNKGVLYASTFFLQSPINSISISTNSLNVGGSILPTLGEFSTYMNSTITGLGSLNYYSTTGALLVPSLTSTFTNLSSYGYITDISSIVNTLVISSFSFGAGSAGYTSSFTLQSSIQGLISTGYIIEPLLQSTLVSTTTGTGSLEYLSSVSYILQSTVEGLGSLNYTSSLTLQSTVLGIQYANSDVIKTNTISTVLGLGSSTYISTFDLQYNIVNLASSKYISTTLLNSPLTSTTLGLTTSGYINSSFYVLQSTVTGLGYITYTSSLSFQSSVQGFQNILIKSIGSFDTNLASTVVGLATYAYLSSLTVQSTIVGFGSLGFVSSSYLQVDLNSTTLGLRSVGYINNTSITLQSTTKGLGSFVYISSLSVQSTVQGLGSIGYISSIESTLTSSVGGLVNIGYINLANTTSTFEGLGSFGYLSTFGIESTVVIVGQTYISSIASTLTSTTAGLVYISSLSLQSTVKGLGSLSYASTSFLNSALTSTILGLTSLQYINNTSITLQSTTKGLGSFVYISTLSLQSTVQGLGSIGYISSIESTLTSTVGGLINVQYFNTSNLTSTLAGLGSSSYISTSFVNANILSTTIGLGSLGFVSSVSFTLQSTVSGLASLNYINNPTLTLQSTIIGLGSLSYISTFDLQSSVVGLGSFTYLSSLSTPAVNMLSTLRGLTSIRYISSSQLQSTVVGLGSLRYVSTPSAIDRNITSSVIGLGSLRYISSVSTVLQSTVTGLGSYNYFSSVSAWVSTMRGVGSFTYLSSFNSSLPTLLNTSRNLAGTHGYTSSLSLRSSINGLGSLMYMSTPSFLSSIPTPFVSTVRGVGSLLYISSSFPLRSTVVGLGSLNYFSSIPANISTTRGLGSLLYISSLGVQSSINGLGSLRYLSSPYTQVSSILIASTITFVDIINNSNSDTLYNSNSTLYFNNNAVYTPISENFTILALSTTTNIPSYMISYDGINWNSSIKGVSVSSITSSNIAYNGNLWVSGGRATGTIQYSSDGFNWKLATNNILSLVNTITNNNSIFVAGGKGRSPNYIPLVYSYDGNTWFPCTNNFTNLGINTVVNLLSSWNGTLFLGFGNFLLTVGNQYIYSYDGIYWFAQSASINLTGVPSCILWNGLFWIAGGVSSTKGSFITSYDGINWINTLITYRPSLFPANSTVTDLFWNGSIYIAILQITSSYASLYYTYDLTTWTQVPGLGGSSYYNPTITWNGSLWISYSSSTATGGTQSMYYSYNGINWILSRNFPSIQNTFPPFTLASRRPLPYIGSSPVSAFVPTVQVSTNTFSFIDIINNKSNLSSLNNSGGRLVFGSISIIDQDSILSSITGLSNIPYIFLPFITSTLTGLGTTNYISSASLFSTVTGLGSIGYLSSVENFTVSTFTGIGSLNYISSVSLQSSINGLGSSQYTSSFHIQSTFTGLGSLNYSSTILDRVLISTNIGLDSIAYISTASLYSTITGLGTLRYLSSASLNSSIISTFTKRINITIIYPSIQSTFVGLGSSRYASTLTLQSSIRGSSNFYANAITLQSTITGIGFRYISVQDAQLRMTSTIDGIGSLRYISSFDLQSTVVGLGSLGYISSIASTLASTTTGIVLSGYINNSTVISGYKNVGVLPVVTTIAIAIGSNAGANTSQQSNAIAIGYGAAFINQGCNSIAIGNSAAGDTETYQDIHSIAIGYEAGYSNQSTQAIAIGYQAGFSTQGVNTVAIGYKAGYGNQQTSSIAIGYQAGYINQSTNSIAIGYGAGYSNQSTGCIQIGSNISRGNDTIIITTPNPAASKSPFTATANTGSCLIYSNKNNGGNTTIGSYSICFVNQTVTRINDYCICIRTTYLNGFNLSNYSIAVSGGAGIERCLDYSISFGNNNGINYTMGTYSVSVFGCNTGPYSICVVGGGATGYTSICLGSKGSGACNYSINLIGPYGISFGANSNYDGGGNQFLGGNSSYSIYISLNPGGGGSLGSFGPFGRPYAIGIGNFAGVTSVDTGANNMSFGSIAIGYNALRNSNIENAIGINNFSGSIEKSSPGNSTSYSINIGYSAGLMIPQYATIQVRSFTYRMNSIAIGPYSGSNMGAGSIYLGFNAGGDGPLVNTTKGIVTSTINSIGIGYYAGYSDQGSSTIAIGFSAGYYGQSTNAIAIGYQAGYSNQSTQAIAIGYQAGWSTQMNSAIAIGSSAGFTNQSTTAIAIGFEAGSNLQGYNSIAIGPGAGQSNQASYAIAIGALAGVNSQSVSSIIFNARGSELNTTTPGFFVNTMRNFTGILQGSNILSYSASTSELFYSDAITISTLFVDIGVLYNGNFLTSDSNVKQNISSADLTLCYSNMKQLPLRRFTYIPSYAASKIDQTQIGFIAQEVYSTFPKSIFSTFDQDLSTSIMNLNFDQVFLSHYGATQLLMSSVEGYQNSISSLQTIELCQQSTLEGQTSLLLTLANSYGSLISKVSSFVGLSSKPSN